jgi:uroporphyrinogen III methyltransferase/synthase
VPEQLASKKMRPPVIVIVGEVVLLSRTLSWFESRPLFGESVLVTRPRDGACDMRQRLAELGAEVLVQPAIEISDPSDWSPVDEAIDQLDRYDWLVFSSANGVDYFLNRLQATGRDLRHLGRLKLAAIGQATAELLGTYRLRADLVPDEYRAEALAARLAEEARGGRVLLARASRGREVLAETLAAACAEVRQIVVYSSTDVTTPDRDVAEALRAGKIAWTTVTSSAIARSLANLFGDDLRQTRLVSISPVTSQTLRSLGHEPAAEATVYTSQGVIDALRTLCESR